MRTVNYKGVEKGAILKKNEMFTLFYARITLMLTQQEYKLFRRATYFWATLPSFDPTLVSLLQGLKRMALPK